MSLVPKRYSLIDHSYEVCFGGRQVGALNVGAGSLSRFTIPQFLFSFLDAYIGVILHYADALYAVMTKTHWTILLCLGLTSVPI